MTGRSRLEVVLLLYRSNAVIIMQLRRMVLSVVALRERERDGAQYMVCVCVCVCGCMSCHAMLPQIFLINADH